MENYFVKYYGEYSLKYWIRLLLNSDIILPDFQRPFVWEKEQVISFINSIKNKQFVPPVIIGNYVDGKKNSNLILDGQQRLCSLLFVYIGMYPIKSQFQMDYDSSLITEYTEEDDEDNNNSFIDANRVLNYLQSLMKNNRINDRMSLINTVKIEKRFQSSEKEEICIYEDLDKFLDNNYLPFIYVKSISRNIDINIEKEYYANLFYNINAKATPLTIQEARNAILWFLGGEIKELLSIELKITISDKTETKDLIYYLAIISYMYKGTKDSIKNIDETVSKLLKGCSSRLGKEQFVLDFINNISNDNYKDIFGRFSEIFSDIKYSIEIIKKCVNNCKKIQYNSVAEFEIRFFGILYWSLFFKYDIDSENCEKDIVKQIDRLLYYNDKKEDYNKNVNTLRRIRYRVKGSIEFYQKYIIKS